MATSSRKPSHRRSRRTRPAAPFVALKIRPATKAHVLRIAGETRLKLADAADVLIEAWDGLGPERQMEIIRRPAAHAAAS